MPQDTYPVNAPAWPAVAPAPVYGAAPSAVPPQSSTTCLRAYDKEEVDAVEEEDNVHAVVAEDDEIMVRTPHGHLP